MLEALITLTRISVACNTPTSAEAALSRGVSTSIAERVETLNIFPDTCSAETDSALIFEPEMVVPRIKPPLIVGTEMMFAPMLGTLRALVIESPGRIILPTPPISMIPADFFRKKRVASPK